MTKQILSAIILSYFRFLARLQLRKNPQATIIGVTGSAGKTSTRLAIVRVLAEHARVKHSTHANSESGIPLNILGLRPTSYSPLDWLRLILLAPIKLLTNREHYDYYVVEMGIDSPDSPANMSSLLSIVTPHVGVVLNASLAHAGGFDHLVKDKSPLRRMAKLVKIIAKEKMQLAQGISNRGVAVINIDQKELVSEARGIKARQITFGKSEKADLRILGNSRFRYLGQVYELNLLDIYPPSFDYTFAAAIATGIAVGIPPSLSLPRLSNYRSPSGRMQLFPGIRDSTIIDSSYNASPTTMLDSLKLLKSLSGKNKKIAVLGDMRELGISEKIAHKNLADWIPLYCDEAILYGDLTKAHTLPVLLSKKFKVHHFSQMDGLISYLRASVTPKSFVLIKGSQNQIFLERAVAGVLKDPSDIARLCRRGPYWDKIRASVV